MDLHIKHLHHEDSSSADDLAHILIAAWRSGFRNILPDSVIEKYTQFEPCTDMFRQILSSGVGTMYLAFQNTRPVGLLYWLPEGDSARIEALLTIPEVWGTGIAAALIGRTIQDTSAHQTIAVWPFAENHRARRFYEKQGFFPTGNSRMGDAEEMEYVYQKPSF
nr:GNAT family N-acetyltransferase [Oscillospiraceae bacterium]